MARETLAQLRERIAELEARNAELAAAAAAARAEAEAARTAAVPSTGSSVTTTDTTATDTITHDRRRWRRTRNIAASVLLVLGLVLAPLGLLVNYADATLRDTDGFVAAFAPLADDPAVQELVTESVVRAIRESVPVEELTSDLVTGIQSLDLPPAAARGLDLLRGPLVNGIESLMTQLVGSFVTSDAFSTIWRETLQLSHSQLNATLANSDSALVRIGDDDAVAIQLGPVIRTVRAELIDSGLTFAELIPTDVEVSIEIANIEGLSQLRAIYALLGALAIWLPILSAVFIVLALAIAPRRRPWFFAAGLTLGLTMTIIGIAVAIMRAIALSSLSIGDAAEAAIIDAATGRLVTGVVWWSILGWVVAIVAFALGFRRVSNAARSGIDRSVAWVRTRRRAAP